MVELVPKMLLVVVVVEVEELSNVVEPVEVEVVAATASLTSRSLKIPYVFLPAMQQPMRLS